MTNTSYHGVPSELTFLLENCGFHVCAGGYIEGGNLQISFPHDRDESNPPIVLIAAVYDEPGPDNWYVSNLLSDIRVLVMKTDPFERPSIAELANFLRDHLAVVDAMFSTSNLPATKQALEVLKDARCEAMYPGLFSNDAPVVDAFGSKTEPDKKSD